MTPEEIINKINSEVWATLAPSKIHGVGVFAIRDILKGTEIGKNWDERIYYMLSDKEFMNLIEPIRNMILDRMQQDLEGTILFRHPNSMARLSDFMNHSEIPNSNGKIALTDIKKGEEITEHFINIAPRKLHSFTLERYKNENIIK